jgi:hypothetical protein
VTLTTKTTRAQRINSSQDIVDEALNADELGMHSVWIEIARKRLVDIGRNYLQPPHFCWYTERGPQSDPDYLLLIGTGGMDGRTAYTDDAVPG